MTYILVPILLLATLLIMGKFGTIAGGFIACFGLGSLGLLPLIFTMWWS